MARFAFIGPSYRSQSVNADCQICMNLYLESIESGQGKSAAALYRRPGLKLLYGLGTAAVRGIITAQGRTFAVAGTTLWELLNPTASPNKINRGNVVSDGLPVSMASGLTQVLFTSAGTLYCFQLIAGTSTNVTGTALAANSLTAIPQFNIATGYGLLQPSVSQVTYSDGFFHALFSNSNQIQCSDPNDGSSWSGVSETQVSVFSDNVVAIHVVHRLLCVLGPNNIQPYFNSGNFPFPYDVYEGGFIEQGLAAANSVATLDNSFFWLGQNKDGAGMVWRANGFTPQRISTHAIEYALSTYTRIDDAVCYGYQEQGHTFYVMNFPTAQKTWVYDCATQQWHERGFWNAQAGIFTQNRAGCHTSNFGMHLVGDPTTGAVYQQSIAFLNDFGNRIRRVRRAPHISTEQARIFHNSLQLDLETGIGPNFPGSELPTIIPILDSAGAVRNFAIGENGVIQAPAAPGGDPTTAVEIFINDKTGKTSWRITVASPGEISPVKLANYDDSLPQAIPFVTNPLGDQRWILELEDLGGGIAVLQTVKLDQVLRGPLVTLKWSNDGGQTFSAGIDRDCGLQGNTLTRVIWRRLGSARDRVYELSMADDADWKIVDAYLFTDPEDRQPTQRFSSEARKRA